MQKFKQPDINQHKVIVCPVSYSQVDKHLIKAYSSIVFIVLAVSLFFHKHFGLYLITIDFLIRVFIGIKYSPLCNLLTSAMRITQIKPNLVNAGTKKIAAVVGLLFSVLIMLSIIFIIPVVTTVLTIMFMVAIGLDLLFDYCLACKMQSMYLSFIRRIRS